MIDRNTATYDTHSHQTAIPAITARAAAGLTKRSEARACSLPGIGRSAAPYSASPADRQVREDSEDYIFDFLSGEDHEADPELSAAADAHTEGLREAERLLDEAVNLVAVLMASMEQEGDARAMQADTVLKIVEKKLNKAHTRIDRQETRHRKLFLAYFELKGQSETDAK